ncbi:sensor histidine kinase [Evansella cellulosilytica]|uniref:histidine kinase n=1 Tax=Evansella cellulosilytica (strain ATCC 21833 / DSM 2522 / FERM P-1141 / JCM 9156 / N-4) TaxID=649639 RepID=E6TXJ8_EVAC2|nr:sensor histidine kinase [Evansella cellulosilytica]ADU28812.1 integral membrane sensor signal transduction histidine kinase [Evansella cellulosilytica DSM 2522]
MTDRQSRLINSILFFVIFGTWFILINDNPNNTILLTILIYSYALIQYFRYLKYRLPIKNPLSIILIMTQLCIAFTVQAVDGWFLAQTYFFILIVEVSYRSSRANSILFMVISYVAYVTAVALHFQFPPFHEISHVVPRFLEYVLFWAFSYIASYAVDQKREMELLNEELRQAAEELEEKTLLQERLRLSKEIHDTVGHTLTTAYIGVETSKHIIQNGKNTEGLEMLEKAKFQIKRSLEDVRSIVHTVSENPNFIDMKKSLIKLIDQTEDHSNITIDYEITESLPDLGPAQQLAIYRALQEGVTNGIRHGGSTHFHYRLLNKGDTLQITLEDNGKFKNNSTYGFGLKAMQQRFQLVGGMVETLKNDKGGCTLKITLPIQYRENINQPNTLQKEGNTYVG